MRIWRCVIVGVYLCTRNRNTALATFSVLTLNLCSQGKCVMGFTYLHLEAWRHPAKKLENVLCEFTCSSLCVYFNIRLETKVKLKFENISQSQRRPLLGPYTCWRCLTPLLLNNLPHGKYKVHRCEIGTPTHRSQGLVSIVNYSPLWLLCLRPNFTSIYQGFNVRKLSA